MKPKPTFASAIALIALFISLGGTVYAAAKINGKTIKVGSIPANRLKADGLGGAQVNEGALATVPRAARAGQAAKATVADRAAEAARAASAPRAERATTATSADLAREADHAEDADLARQAPTAATLGGVPGRSLRSTCRGDGAVMGYVVFDPKAPGDHKLAEFSCGEQGVVVEPMGAGQYRIAFPGLVGARIGLGSAFGLHGVTSVRVDPVESSKWQAQVYSSLDEGFLADEAFSVSVF